jgi:hypothetical protein
MIDPRIVIALEWIRMVSFSDFALAIAALEIRDAHSATATDWTSLNVSLAATTPAQPESNPGSGDAAARDGRIEAEEGGPPQGIVAGQRAFQMWRRAQSVPDRHSRDI